MNQRLFLHFGLLIYAIIISQTLSILPFILPVALISIVGASRNDNINFDAIDIFWLLYQLSFVLSPARTFREEDGDILFSHGVIVNLWKGDMIYQQSELIILFLILLVVAIINLFILPRGQNVEKLKNSKSNLSLLVLFIILYLAFLADIQLRGGVGNVLSARYNREQGSLSIFSIFSTSLFLASFWLTAVKIKSLSSLKRTVGFIALVIPAVVLYNPFNAARFGIIQAWLPFMLIFWPWLRRFSIFSSAIAFGIVVLMPILSSTTRNGLNSDISAVNINFTDFLDFLDQHIVSLHLIDMVERNGYQIGGSILSVIGFFIPRAIWEDKPLVIGLEVGNELYAGHLVGTPNLSGPIFLDFYYDFGISGVIIGSILTALLFRQLLKIGGRVNGIPLVDYIILSALPIVFRGSVGAVIGVVFFSLLFYYFLLHIAGRISWAQR